MVVKVDHIFKRGQAAVVHVGRGPGHLTQSRGFEVAAGRAFVGEVRADVAGRAVGFAAKDLKPSPPFGREGVAVAVDIWKSMECSVPLRVTRWSSPRMPR